MNYIGTNEFIKCQQDNILNSENQTDSLVVSIPKKTINQLGYNLKHTENQYLLKTNNTIIQSTDSISKEPTFSNINFKNKSLIEYYSKELSTNKNQDSFCYITFKKPHNELKPVFYTRAEIVKPNINQYLLKEKVNENNDWLMIPLLFGSVLFVSATILYRKYLSLFFEGLIYGNQSNRIINEKNTQTRRLSLILDIIFIISLSVLVDLIFKKFNIYLPPQKFPYLLFVLSFVFLVFLKAYYWMVYKLTAVFSNQSKFIYDLLDISSLYTRCLGFLLLPLVILISYSTGSLPTIFIYFSISIFIIFLIYRVIRMTRLFIGSGFSIFYFILYLCALEIAPLLLAYREVIALSKES